jgi:hypothetical protein
MDWINNVRVDLNVGSPLPIRVDFSLGPYYAIGDQVRLVDLDPTAGYVLGKVIDVKKYPDKGTFAYIEWKESEIIHWEPQKNS